MDGKNLCVALGALAVTFAALGAGNRWTVEPTTCHWIGAVEHRTKVGGVNAEFNGLSAAAWTNENNWAEGVVPGAFEVAQGDGTIVTNGSLNCTAVFDGDCDIHCVETLGLVSISNILVTGSTAPHFLFGHNSSKGLLKIVKGGSFRVTSDVPQAPYIFCNIIMRDVVSAGRTMTIENNSAGPFSMGYFSNIEPKETASQGTLTFRYEGTGAIRKRNKNYRDKSGWACELAMSGGRYVVDTGLHATMGTASCDTYSYLWSVDNGHTQTVEIPDSKVFVLGGAAAIKADGDLSIVGDGTLYLELKNSIPACYAAAGKTLDIATAIMRPPDTSAASRGFKVGASGYAGRVRLSGANAITGAVNIVNGATLEVPSFGFGDAPGPIGKTGVTIENSSFLRYTGDGETTDRSIGATGLGTIILAGSGDLIWKGPFTGGTTYAYTISNESHTARFVYAGASLAKYVTLVTGSRLGFAKPDETDAIAVSRLEVSGNASIDVGDGVTVSVATFARSSGKRLAITLSGSGKLILPGVTEGPAGDEVTVNGKAAWYGSDGSVFALEGLSDSRTIAAHGAVVPDAPGEAVGITEPGDPADGHDTLAASLTRVLTLNQETSEPAVIDVGAGQTLQANLIRVKAGAGALTIGAAPGEGRVTAAQAAFETQVDDAASTLTVNSTIDVPAALPIKTYGEGTTVFSALNGYAGRLSLAGNAVVFTNGATGLSATLGGTGTVDLADSTFRLVSSEGDGISATCQATNAVSLMATGGKMKLSSGNKPLPVSKIRVVQSGALELTNVCISTPGVTIETESPATTFFVGSNRTSTVRLESGAVTGRLELAYYVSSTVRAAMYQTGGEFVNVTPYAETMSIGYRGFGYYALKGGRLVAAGDWYLGGTGEGVLDIDGGELWHTPSSIHKSRCRIGADNCYAAVRVANGGVFDAANTLESVLIPGYNRSETSAEFTVEDGGTVRMDKQYKGVSLGMGKSATYSHSVVNLNGGTFGAYSVHRPKSYVYPTAEWPEGTSTDKQLTNTYAFVNCNGGTFVNYGWGAAFGSRTSYSIPPNRVTLFEKGLIFDSNGMDCSLGAGGGLQAPSGQGVASIPWNAATDGAGYIGSPIVKIVGDGKGATAWADFDIVSGLVTNIHVTSPGNDYTYANALITMNRTTVKTIPCTLGTFASGGLTKIGSAALKVAATNTYTGATTIRKGTLMLMADDVISSASALVLDGGTLDLNGMSQTFSSLSVTTNGGNVLNGTLSLSGLTIDLDDVRANGPLAFGGALRFAPGAALEVRNAGTVARPPVRYRLATFTGEVEGMPLAVSPSTLEALPAGWQIKQAGGEIVLLYPVGTTMIIR